MSLGVLKKGVFRVLLFFTFFFNLLDAAFSTLYFSCVSDVSGELNPITRYFLSSGFPEFILFKLSIVSFGLLILWKYRHHLLAQVALVVLFIIYALVVCAFVCNLGLFSIIA